MPDAPLFPADPEVERAWLYDTLEEVLQHIRLYNYSLPNSGAIRQAINRYSSGLPMNTSEVS